MGLTREQFDIISNSYNNRRVKNKLIQNQRIQEVYQQVPEMQRLDANAGSIALSAVKKSLLGGEASSSIKEDLSFISQQRKALLLGAGFPADYLDDIFDCPDCKDTGFIFGKPCECLKKEIVELLFSRSELKEVLGRENFDSFNFDYYSDDFVDEQTGLSSLENMEAIVDQCQYYIRNFNNAHSNLLFYGTAGTGKTFLINCIAKELIEKSYSVVYLSAVQFFDFLADYNFRKSNSSIYRQISISELQSCDLLIIDDLGTEMSNSFTESALFDCLNERLIHRKSTIISTNFSIGELQSKYEERIFSRIIGNYTHFRFFGDDIRIKKKLNV